MNTQPKCPTCDGSGNVYYRNDSTAYGVAGPEDLWDPAPCPSCGGTGIATCDYCGEEPATYVAVGDNCVTCRKCAALLLRESGYCPCERVGDVTQALLDARMLLFEGADDAQCLAYIDAVEQSVRLARLAKRLLS
jgi:hypothetical protein